MTNPTQTFNVRLDRKTIAWLDRIAVGAATDRGTVAAVLLTIRVERDFASDNAAPRAATAPRMLTIPQAADALGVHQTAIMRHLGNGNLTRHKEGRHTLLDAREVEGMRGTIKPRKKRAARVAKRAKRKGK